MATDTEVFAYAVRQAQTTPANAVSAKSMLVFAKKMIEYSLLAAAFIEDAQ